MIIDVPMLSGPPMSMDLDKIDFSKIDWYRLGNDIYAKIDWPAFLKMLLTLVPGLLTSIVAKEVWAKEHKMTGPLTAYNQVVTGMEMEAQLNAPKPA